MRFIITILLVTALCTQLLATAQAPDKIIYKGKTYNLHSNPLEAYFERYPDKRPQDGVMSTGLWRGYIATFEISDEQLYLKDIEIMYYDSTATGSDSFKWRSVRGEVFPGQEKIKIDWLTGILVIPHGKMTNYVHMGYGSTYKKYILLEIDKGDLKQVKRFRAREYEKFREKQFQAFKLTEEYRTIRETLMKEGGSEDFIDSFLRSYVVEYTSKILVD